MLALVVSLLFALYIFGPDAFSRFILDFSVPRRSVTLTRSEEVYRAVAWAAGSFVLAYGWARAQGALLRVWDGQALQVFFSGIYSEQMFREHPQAWFTALHSVISINVCLLWRMYVVVFLLSLALCILIRYYAQLRYWLSGDDPFRRWLRDGLAAVILPRIAPWHLLLSRIYVRDRRVQIHLDVLTKMNILYRGAYESKFLAADGALLSLSLARPQRFQREDYKAEKAKGTQPKSDAFWKPIPNDVFVISGAEVHSLNIRYVLEVENQKRPRSREFSGQIKALREAIEQLKTVQSNMDVTLRAEEEQIEPPATGSEGPLE